jgi:hypothetical protein
MNWSKHWCERCPFAATHADFRGRPYVGRQGQSSATALGTRRYWEDRSQHGASASLINWFIVSASRLSTARDFSPRNTMSSNMCLNTLSNSLPRSPRPIGGKHGNCVLRGFYLCDRIVGHFQPGSNFGSREDGSSNEAMLITCPDIRQEYRAV